MNDPASWHTVTKKEMNFEAMLEKLAYDLYQELGRGIFEVPKSYLSRQRILDDFTKRNAMTLFLAGTPDDFVAGGLHADDAPQPARRVSNESLRIMSRMVEGYQDFDHVQTRDDGGAAVKFIEFIAKYRRPPEQLLTPDGTLVPLRGLVGLLAVGRILADSDVIGGTGGNAGFVWVKDATQKIVAAQTVKIDPGMAFQFEGHDGANWVDNTYRKSSGRVLRDIRDLQIAQNNDLVTVYWSSLSPAQKTEFLQVLFNSSRYLNFPEILDYLFYRDGRFSRSGTEQNPQEKADQFREQTERWLRIQLEIYQEELNAFKQEHHVQIASVQQIDQWGEFLLEQQQQLVEQAVAGLSRRLEETNQELVTSRVVQEAMRSELQLAQQRAEEAQEAVRQGRESSEARLGEVRQQLEVSRLGQEAMGQIVELARRDIAQAVQLNQNLARDLELNRQRTGEVEDRLQATQLLYEESQRTLRRGMEESEARVREMMGRLERLEAARPGPSVPDHLPVAAFGAAEWGRYFGDVGVEPPLPPDIEEILGMDCPFWSGKRIRETHLLVLIPARVNGEPYTLDYLEEWIQKPKGGGRPTKYRYYLPDQKGQQGKRSVEQSYWVLTTKDVLLETKGKSYTVQREKLGGIVRRYPRLKGEVSTVLEATTSVLMEYVKGGDMLFKDCYARCLEQISGYQAVVGGFSAAGLCLHDHYGVYAHVGVGCSWKF